MASKTIRINWVTHNTHLDKATQWNAEHNKNKGDDWQAKTSGDLKLNRQYVVDRITHHLETPQRTRYIVHLYKYNEHDDTTERAENISKHFRHAYRQRVCKQKSTRVYKRKRPRRRRARAQYKHWTTKDQTWTTANQQEDHWGFNNERVRQKRARHISRKAVAEFWDECTFGITEMVVICPGILTSRVRYLRVASIDDRLKYRQEGSRTPPQLKGNLPQKIGGTLPAQKKYPSSRIIGIRQHQTRDKTLTP